MSRNLTLLLQFQSTLPARGATQLFQPPPMHRRISIHAPRTGSDDKKERLITAEAISIHAPRTGSDLIQYRIAFAKCNFNPRSPHGERPPNSCYSIRAFFISIHAPRTGSDEYEFFY